MGTWKTLIGFALNSDVAVISNPSLKGKCVRVYTERGGLPVRNHCDVCYRSYCDVQSLRDTSIMSSTVKVIRCPHSENVRSYLVAS